MRTPDTINMTSISERLLICANLSDLGKNFADTPQACRAAAFHLQWHKLSENLAWKDGRDLVLLAHGMEVQARYCKGEWQYHLEGKEYDGPVWSCFDDEFQIEIEDCDIDPALWHHGPATHWRELTERPSVNDSNNSEV